MFRRDIVQRAACKLGRVWRCSVLEFKKKWLILFLLRDLVIYCGSDFSFRDYQTQNKYLLEENISWGADKKIIFYEAQIFMTMSTTARHQTQFLSQNLLSWRCRQQMFSTGTACHSPEQRIDISPNITVCLGRRKPQPHSDNRIVTTAYTVHHRQKKIYYV